LHDSSLSLSAVRLVALSALTVAVVLPEVALTTVLLLAPEAAVLLPRLPVFFVLCAPEAIAWPFFSPDRLSIDSL